MGYVWYTLSNWFKLYAFIWYKYPNIWYLWYIPPNCGLFHRANRNITIFDIHHESWINYGSTLKFGGFIWDSSSSLGAWNGHWMATKKHNDWVVDIHKLQKNIWCNYSGGYPHMQNLDWPMCVLMMCIYVYLRSKNTYKLGLVYVMMMTIYYLDWFMF